jgi:hypothetical protein
MLRQSPVDPDRAIFDDFAARRLAPRLQLSHFGWETTLHFGILDFPIGQNGVESNLSEATRLAARQF